MRLHSLDRHHRRGTHREARLLQPICDEVQEVNELAEHEALRSRILLPQVAQLLDEGFDLRR